MKALPDLPRSLQGIIEEKLDELVALDDHLKDREIFLQQWGNSLEDLYAEDADEGYELHLYFEEETMEQVRELLAIKYPQKEDSDIDAELPNYIYQLLGEALLEAAEPLFFGGYEREEMAKVGETLKLRA